MAEQTEPVQRRVALKMIKPGMDTRADHRPLRSRTAGAGDDGSSQHRQGADAVHDRIGQPYFVMELVQGIPITEYCDEQTHTANDLSCSCRSAKPSSMRIKKGSSTAIIKPSNVLVPCTTSKPVPKVIDFGWPKRLDISD